MTTKLYHRRDRQEIIAELRFSTRGARIMRCIVLALIFIVRSHSVPAKISSFSFSKLHQDHFLAAQELLQKPICQHIYLDMGTNRGMQIRKLYEPELYPKGSMHNLYVKYFGEQYNKSQVCTFGFEPNKMHEERLQNLSRGYESMGYHNVIFTETAVGARHGNISFFVEPFNNNTHQWGSSIYNYRAGFNKVTVALFHVAHFIKTELIPRQLPMPSQPARILVKMDVEGTEYDVLPSLLQHGAICALSGLFIEYHRNQVVHGKPPPEKFPENFAFIADKFEHCKVDMGVMSDDTYVAGNDLFPLPPPPYNITA